MPLRSRYPRASHTFSRLVGAGGLCYSTSLATGFQPSNPRKMKPLAVVVTASDFHSTVTTRRDSPARIATSSCEDWCVVYQKVRLSRKGVNSGVANQQLIRHGPLTSPIGLPDHLSFDLSGWRYRRVNPVVLRPTEPFLLGKPLSCAFLCLVRQLRVEPDRRVRGKSKASVRLLQQLLQGPLCNSRESASASRHTKLSKVAKNAAF